MFLLVVMEGTGSVSVQIITDPDPGTGQNFGSGTLDHGNQTELVRGFCYFFFYLSANLHMLCGLGSRDLLAGERRDEVLVLLRLFPIVTFFFNFCHKKPGYPERGTG